MLLFVLGHPCPSMSRSWLQSLCQCPCSGTVSPQLSPTQPPLPPPLPKPARYAQLRCKGHPELVLGHSLEWCNLWVTALYQRAQKGGLHDTDAALRRSAASLSLHHTPLRHASTPRLVKACQNNPLNPQRKDLIKLFYSGIHAAFWTAYSMTSSMI